MAVGIKCPYCGKIGYTSSPQTNPICPYCEEEHDFPREEEVRTKGKPIILIPGKNKRGKSEQFNL